MAFAQAQAAEPAVKNNPKPTKPSQIRRTSCGEADFLQRLCPLIGKIRYITRTQKNKNDSL
ncbi:MAG: hypothetical protein RugAbin2_02117 [Rugosibacter sp.]|jgi:hypothetical protein|nr:hypothetical protein [Rugosibacter sp.]